MDAIKNFNARRFNVPIIHFSRAETFSVDCKNYITVSLRHTLKCIVNFPTRSSQSTVEENVYEEVSSIILWQ